MLLLLVLVGLVGLLTACGGVDGTPVDSRVGEDQSGAQASAARTRPITGIYDALRLGALPLVWENNSGRVLAGYYNPNLGALRLSRVLVAAITSQGLTLVLADGSRAFAASTVVEVRLGIGAHLELLDDRGAHFGRISLSTAEETADLLEVRSDPNFSPEATRFEGDGE